MHYLARVTLLIATGLLLGACASLVSERDPPKVTLNGIRTLPGAEGAPRFEIALRVINPNSEPLKIEGISYTIALLDRDLISGVSNKVPTIDGYSEQVVLLEASLQLFELLRLFAEAGGTRPASEPFDYRFAAKIDFKGVMPTQRIEESGELLLR